MTSNCIYSFFVLSLSVYYKGYTRGDQKVRGEIVAISTSFDQKSWNYSTQYCNTYAVDRL